MLNELVSRNSQIALLLLIAALLLLISGYSYYRSSFEGKQVIRVATGERSGESYKIMQAVSQLINNDDYEFELKVVSTQGSIENNNLLKEGLVHMATIQSDISIDKDIRLVANLYEDVFHFIIQPSIDIESIEEVRSLKVAVPSKSSGENGAFIRIKEHFGLTEDKVQPIVSTWNSATWLFKNGDIDAIFKVREATHPRIKKLIRETNAQCNAITQAAAISLHYPVYHSATIPKGAYIGIPANPQKTLETLGVERVLIASSTMPESIIKDISTVLFTRKRELVDIENLAGLATVPEENSLIPLHNGLISFVNKERPSFFQKNAEFLALILSVIVLAGSSLLQFFNRSKQQKLNTYNEQLLSIKVNIEQTNNLGELHRFRDEHYALVNQIVSDAVHGKITSAGFEFFTFGWDSVTKLINEKEKSLTNER